MSRYENDDLKDVKVVKINEDGNEEVFIPDPNEYNYTCILSNGKVVESSDNNVKDTCAYCFESSSGRIKYFVLCCSGTLYDPEKRNDVRYNRRNNWRMRSVTHEIFKLYTQYLGISKSGARRGQLLRNAERLL